MKTRSLLISLVGVLAMSLVCAAADKPAPKKPAKPRPRKARPRKHVVAPPAKAPKIEPRPPKSDIPPITTAVMD